jgi:hypothetical protein
MNILKKLFERIRTPAHLFDNAPYLCPWYFNETNPKLTKHNEPLKWKWIEKIGEEYVGVSTLVDQRGRCFGIVKTYTYLLPGPTNDEFLAWSRTSSKPSGSPEIKMSLYATDMLQPIENSEELVLKYKDSKVDFFYFNGEPKTTIPIALKPEVEYIHYEFPAEFKSFPDFCAVVDVPELYKDGNEKLNNTAILLLKPNEKKIYVYPQDWFNKSDADFGYQWITRAAINPSSGLLHGQGIRISDFILDKTGRQIL